MHSIKWVVHVCKNQGNKRERERELPEKWAGKLYFYASSKTKKQVTSAKSYPKWPVARVISHLLNSNLSFMSYHWKTTSSPQCPNHCVRRSVTFPYSPAVSNLWFKNNDALHENEHCWKWCQHLLIQLRTIQRLYVRWTHSHVCRLSH